MTRSIFLKNESFSDVQSALSKANTEEERKRLIWDRMKQNGCTKESEIAFREHCQAIGFILPDEAGKRNPLEKNVTGRIAAGMLRNAIKHQRDYDKIIENNMEEK